MLKTTLQTPTLLSAVTLAILFSGGLLFTTTNTVQAAEMSTKGLHDQVKFDISAGSLSSVLNQFGQQADILLTYSPELTQGLQSQGLRGEYSVEAGLTQLLKSTSLTVQKQADKSFLITDTGSTSALLPVVTVTGQQTVISPYAPLAGYAAVRSTSATKGSADLLDTPQSVSVITQQQLQLRGALNVQDALRYTPSLSVPYGYDTRYDWFSLRGFDAKSQVYRDGLLQPTSLYGLPRADNYTLERIEVLRGPSSVLYGQAQPGGLVNLVSKRPTEETRRELRVSAGSDDFAELSGDFSGAIDEDGQFLYRLIVLGNEANTEVDQNETRRKLIAPSITWNISDDTQLTLLALQQKDDQIYSFNQHLSPYILEAFNAIGTTYDIDNGFFIGDDDFNKFERDYQSVGYEFSHVINDSWAFRQNLRYDKVDLNYRYLSLRGGNPLTADLQRNAAIENEKLDALAIDNRLETVFDTGALAHQMMIGLDWRYSNADEQRYRSNAPSINYLSPDYDQEIAYPALLKDREVYSRQTGAYLQDQIAYNKWRLMVGGRYDWVKTDIDVNFDRENSASDVSQSEKQFSGRLGLVYKFDNGIAPYISYSEAFNVVNDTDVNGNLFDPELSDQYEIGVKFQPEGSDSFISLALFELTKENYVLSEYNSAGVATRRQVGEVKSKGVEIEAAMALSDSFRLSAAYSYINARITKSPNAWEEDSRTPMQPDETASVWLDYTQQTGMFKNLGLGLGLRYVGQSSYSTLNNNTIAFVTGETVAELDSESYTVMDASLRYQIQNIGLALHVTNLFDKEYDTSCTEQLCYFGEGRRVMLTGSYNW
jgi:iron complex outermembrane receptor protein|tara:strand:+ start:668 stop:3142 length:2475 start_codon:yes stop_codon:yes gene_type:complete